MSGDGDVGIGPTVPGRAPGPARPTSPLPSSALETRLRRGEPRGLRRLPLLQHASNAPAPAPR